MRTTFTVATLAWGLLGPLLAVSFPSGPAGNPTQQTAAAIQATEDVAAATDLYRQAAAADAGNIALHAAYMERMLALNEPALASDAAVRLTELQPENGRAWAVVAYMLAQYDQLADAVTSAVKAVDLAPGDGLVLAVAGQLYARYDVDSRPPALPTDVRQRMGRQEDGFLVDKPAFMDAYRATISLYEQVAAAEAAQPPEPAAQEDQASQAGQAHWPEAAYEPGQPLGAESPAPRLLAQPYPDVAAQAEPEYDQSSGPEGYAPADYGFDTGGGYIYQPVAAPALPLAGGYVAGSYGFNIFVDVSVFPCGLFPFPGTVIVNPVYVHRPCLVPYVVRLRDRRVIVIRDHRRDGGAIIIRNGDGRIVIRDPSGDDRITIRGRDGHNHVVVRRHDAAGRAVFVPERPGDVRLALVNPAGRHERDFGRPGQGAKVGIGEGRGGPAQAGRPLAIARGVAPAKPVLAWPVTRAVPTGAPAIGRVNRPADHLGTVGGDADDRARQLREALARGGTGYRETDEDGRALVLGLAVSRSHGLPVPRSSGPQGALGGQRPDNPLSLTARDVRPSAPALRFQERPLVEPKVRAAGVPEEPTNPFVPRPVAGEQRASGFRLQASGGGGLAVPEARSPRPDAVSIPEARSLKPEAAFLRAAGLADRRREEPKLEPPRFGPKIEVRVERPQALVEPRPVRAVPLEPPPGARRQQQDAPRAMVSPPTEFKEAPAPKVSAPAVRAPRATPSGDRAGLSPPRQLDREPRIQQPKLDRQDQRDSGRGRGQ